MKEPVKVTTPFTSTRNACKLCAPLGACFVFRGIEGCIPLIHGSQGCSTYIRRYGISHFREPIDIASSNFTEASAIFGGGQNLKTALENVTKQYRPLAIGVTSTCLSETIGENVPMYLSQYRAETADREGGGAPVIFYASTPSYRGTHMDGFHEAIFAAVSALAAPCDSAPSGSPRSSVNLISGFVSTEDIRELHEILGSFGLEYTLLPDYSETLDGGSWETYQKLPEGGTPLASIKAMGSAAETLYLGVAVSPERHAGRWLEAERGVPLTSLYLPVGIEQTDRFFEALSRLSGKPVPAKWQKARARLVDAYIDGHKYCSGKKAILYGEEDFVLGLASFLDEIGITPVLAATGAKSPQFAERLYSVLKNTRSVPVIADDADFEEMLALARAMDADFVMGNSKGLYLSRNLGIPLVRCGFPIHDRIGGQRLLHLGYRGVIGLFDLVCNALMEAKQEAAKSGYTYI